MGTILPETGKAVIVVIDYSPLWETMRAKNISQYKLLQSGIDNKTLDALKKNKNITKTSHTNKVY